MGGSFRVRDVDLRTGVSAMLPLPSTEDGVRQAHPAFWSRRGTGPAIAPVLIRLILCAPLGQHPAPDQTVLDRGRGEKEPFNGSSFDSPNLGDTSNMARRASQFKSLPDERYAKAAWSSFDGKVAPSLSAAGAGLVA